MTWPFMSRTWALPLILNPPHELAPFENDPSGIKWGCCDGVHGGVRPTLEVGVGPLRDEGVPPGHRLLQVGQGDFLCSLPARMAAANSSIVSALKNRPLSPGVGRFDIPLRAVNRRLIEDCPDRTGEKMRWLGAFVDGQGSVNGTVVVIDLLDRVGLAVAPISLNVLIPFLDGAILWILARPKLLRNPHLVEQSLSNLVDGDQVLEAGGADVDSTRATVGEVGPLEARDRLHPWRQAPLLCDGRRGCGSLAPSRQGPPRHSSRQ